jgi:hypothetical protein
MRFIVLFFCLFILKTSAGQARINTVNEHAWLMYFGNHRIAKPWGWHAEVQWRRHNWFSENQQLLLRTGLEYYTSGNNRFTVGYAFVETYPYGEFAVANAFPEHRIWEQFFTVQTLGKVKLSHRYRLEQRMLGNAATGEMKGGRYENRMRYMVKATHNLTNSWKHDLYGAVYNEIFINFGKDVAYNVFDQNRLYGALGIVLSPSVRLEIGYVYQLIQLRSLTANNQLRLEDNHTLQFGLFHALDWRRSE